MRGGTGGGGDLLDLRGLGEVLDLQTQVRREGRAGGDQVAEDHVFFQSESRVYGTPRDTVFALHAGFVAKDDGHLTAAFSRADFDRFISFEVCV